MTAFIPKTGFLEIVQATANTLKPAGFAKRGMRLSARRDHCIAIIEFQSSRSSTSDAHRFTVNLGIWAERLLDAGDAMPDRVSVQNAHLCQRLGFLMDEKIDHWWTICRADDVAPFKSEILALLQDRALPFLREFQSEQALLDLWGRGQAIGITEGQRIRFLGELRARVDGS